MDQSDRSKFLWVAKLLYSSKCLSVRDKVGETWFSRLLWQREGWNFVTTWYLFCPIVCWSTYKIKKVLCLFFPKKYTLDFKEYSFIPLVHIPIHDFCASLLMDVLLFFLLRYYSEILEKLNNKLPADKYVIRDQEFSEKQMFNSL